jgi:hypothetical protein
MHSSGCSSAIIPLFSLAHCPDFTVSLTYKTLQAFSALAFDASSLARQILQPHVMRAVLDMRTRLPVQHRAAAVGVINVAVQWGTNSSLGSADHVNIGGRTLGDDVVNALAHHLDLPDALAALHTLCDAAPLRVHVLMPSSFIDILLQPHHWQHLTSHIRLPSFAFSPGSLAAYSLTLVNCMLDQRWEDVASIIGADAPLLTALQAIWTHGQVAPGMRAQALSIAAAAVSGPAADDVLNLFIGNNSLVAAVASSVVSWEENHPNTDSVSAVDLLLLRNTAAFIESLCVGSYLKAAQPSSSSRLATRAIVCERIVSTKLTESVLRLLRASDTEITSHAVAIIHALAAASSRNRLLLLSAGAVASLASASTSGRPAVRVQALDTLTLLLVHDDAAAYALAAADADGPTRDAATAARSNIDELMPVFLSAAASGELLMAAVLPLLDYAIVALGAVEHFVAR